MSDLIQDNNHELLVFDDPSTPDTSARDIVYPVTTIGQIFDETSATHESLRSILDRMYQSIVQEGLGTIKFPVTSVNSKTGDVVLTKDDIGLGNVDNTSDADKPLSELQKEAVTEIIQSHEFNSQLDPFYNHMEDTDNPHNVSFEDINSDGSIDKIIYDGILAHQISQLSSVHPDIRNSLNRLWAYVETIQSTVDDKLLSSDNVISSHESDTFAHNQLFSAKEDANNKVNNFDYETNNTYSQYPSVRSVVNYVTTEINSVSNNLTGLKDFNVVETKADLPTASKETFKEMYLIKDGVDSYIDIAVCKLVDDQYQWIQEHIGAISTFDKEHFTDTSNGLAIDLDYLSTILMVEGSIINTTIKEQVDASIAESDYVWEIDIITGVDDGCIRYYINGDESTMSSNIRVSGLAAMAFHETVSEQDIDDDAIRSNHITDNAILNTHLSDNCVTSDKVTCKQYHIIGNLASVTGEAYDVPIEDLASAISSLLGTSTFNSIQSTDSMISTTETWEYNVEQELGNDTFGKRLKGTVTAVANDIFRIYLDGSINSNCTEMIDCGGVWTTVDGVSTRIGTDITGDNNAVISLTSSGILFESVSTQDRTNASYDIWIKYTKM